MVSYTLWTQQEDAALADMIARNLSYNSIARLMGRTQDAVRGRVRQLRNNDPLGDRAANWNDERDLILLKMTAAGRTRGEIARKFGLSHHSVTRRLARLLEEPTTSRRSQPSPVPRAQTGGCFETVDRHATRQFEKHFREVAARRGWAVREQDAHGRWYLPSKQVAA
jgi:DNA-binding CsgD family transcriptional regulator